MENAPTDLFPAHNSSTAEPATDPGSGERSPRKSKGRVPTIILAVVVVLVMVASLIFVIYTVNLRTQYAKAAELLYAQDYQAAYDIYTGLGDYENSRDYAELSRSWGEYQKAKELYDSGDFKAAQDVFAALGEFEQAPSYVTLCGQNIDYLDAQRLYEQGDYDEALELYNRLAEIGFSDAALCVQKTKYAQAEELLAAADLYGAYKIFTGIGTYEDAATRALQCTTTLPDTGVLYTNAEYVSKATELKIDGTNLRHPGYFKIYAKDTLVASVWVNMGTSALVGLPAGEYHINQAAGDVWFGEAIMFGDEGAYSKMIFDGKETLALTANMHMALALSSPTTTTGDTTSANAIGREGF